ncbi:MAG: NHLP family bacteriocin export ABC transporter peptidase/permease/ATPase subunit [Clostridia bacterium]|nr:NHLP family bacteriocin export ABC transporter peptidase/permease/ATPase subunit [Clostridia bacterium]
MAKGKEVKQPLTKGVAKVPIVVQLETLECGAACLAMVLAYYGKWIPLEKLRSDCGVSRDGSKAVNILRAARTYQLKANGYRFTADEIKKAGKFPCVIHWNYNHFVVLDGFRGNKAVINDPSDGKYSVSKEIFEKSYTGVCLMFEPEEDFKPEGKPKSVIRFAKNRLSGAGSAMLMIFLLTLISSLIAIILPIFSRIFMDRLLTGENPEWAQAFIIALAVLSCLMLIVSFIKEGANIRIKGKLAAYGSTSFLWKVLCLPMEFFSQRMAGDIQLRQRTNESIAGTLVTTFAPLVLQAIMMVLYLVVMISYSWVLTAVGLISIIINLIMAWIISKKRVNITRVQMRDEAKLSNATVSGIEMIETIKASGAENGYFNLWAGNQAEVNTQEVRMEKVSRYLEMIPSLVSSLTNIFMLALGVYLTIQGQFTIGMLVAFQGFFTEFSSPAGMLISASQALQEMRTEMERVEDVMQYPSDSNYGNAQANETDEYDKLSGNIEIKNVTFGYSKLDKPLIEDFSMSIKQGGRVAFVGVSGCGKSTLSKLISGLYKPWSGEILFDGKPISEIDRSVFTGSLAVVDQDIILFEDTIANNIKMWDNSIEDFEVIMAARDAHLHEDIMKRDGGYNYMITEGGKNFSGGQKQRIEIARVLAQDPTIIIMDEATSALDAKTEYEVINSIKERGITCIVIAHRLSTIRDCDEIIVLDNGKVVERGTHEELFARQGAYYSLVTSE